MKNFIKISFGVIFLAIGIWYILYKSNEPEKKSSNFRSYQKEVIVTVATAVKPSAKEAQPPKQRSIATPKTIAKTSTIIKSARLNSFTNFLDHKVSKWSWSPNVFVLEKDKYKGPKNNILGSHDGFDVIKDKNKPKDALSLVYNSAEKRTGIYTGKIIVVHQKTSDFEDKIKNITGVNVEYVSGVYFLSSDSLADATQLVATIQNGIPSAQIDLDINYAFDRAN